MVNKLIHTKTKVKPLTLIIWVFDGLLVGWEYD